MTAKVQTEVRRVLGNLRDRVQKIGLLVAVVNAAEVREPDTLYATLLHLNEVMWNGRRGATVRLLITTTGHDICIVSNHPRHQAWRYYANQVDDAAQLLHQLIVSE